MKISLVTTCYNSEKTLERCISSVLSQTRTPDEFILVNDGSTDKTRDIMKGFSILNTPIDIRIIDMPANMGAGVAKVAGIKTATGDAVTFLDSDDELLSDALYSMERAMIKDDSDIVCAACNIIKQDGSVTKESYIEGVYNFPECFEKFTSYDFVNVFACSKLIKRSILEKIPYSFNRYEEDSDTLYKWFYSANRVSVINQPCYNYYMYDNSLSRHKVSIKKIMDGLNAIYDEIVMRKSIGVNICKPAIVCRLLHVQSNIDKLDNSSNCSRWEKAQVKTINEKIKYLNDIVGIS